MKKYTLGLDIGANSVGWALINDEPTKTGDNIITGVRVFPEGTENTKAGEQSRNLKRRDARQMRRQLDRRTMRKRRLRKVLINTGCFPDDEKKINILLEKEPYELRRKALDEKLSKEDFSRALMHICQRRGFKSSLKTQGAEAKEQEGIKGEISGLQKNIEESDARTLGEYFAGLIEKGEAPRGRHTSRQMYMDEFEKIWSKQASYSPDVWTDGLKKKVYDAIFYQRPLKPQDHLIGKCDLEPDEKRCHRASWYAQQFRLLQEVNNLRVLSRRYGEVGLVEEERNKLIEELMKKREIKVEVIKDKILELAEVESLNYERTERDKMEGNLIEAGLQKIYKKEYKAKAEWLRETVWEYLINEDHDDFVKKAKEEWKMPDQEIEALYNIKRPKDGYFSYSLKAIKKLLPYLEEGKDLYEAKEAAGYRNGEREKVGYLPLIHVNDFRNPVVTRAISETRKVVNAIVREYGMPSEIVVEMARETKGTIKSRREQNLKNLKMNAYHEDIKKKLDELKVPANHETILKYKLWEECSGICPYTGQSISLHELYGDHCRFDIEHIFPYSKSFDDSFINKTLCERIEDSKKGNRTPYEAYHGDKEKYEQILIRVKRNKKMPYEKVKRFSMKEIPDDFTNRQLNDTTYIAKAIRGYLEMLGTKVRTTRGQITDQLRWQWGLNAILNTEGNTKSREDHRHHAVDAVVIALTTTRHLNVLQHKYDFISGQIFPSPWEEIGIEREEFRQTVIKSIDSINVSHRPQRKVSGQLNKETNYGKTKKDGVYVFRVDIRNLTPAMADDIVDPVVKKIVCDRILEHGFTPGKGSSALPAAVFAEELRMKTKNGKEGPVIKSVRVHKNLKNLVGINDKNGKPYRYVETRNNHHVTIFEYKDEKGEIKRCKEIVSRFEAANRVLKGEPVIRKTHPDHPEATFLMSLSINDMVYVEQPDGSEVLCRIQKMSGSEREEGIDISFRIHTASTLKSKDSEIRISSLSVDKFKVRKVFVDLLGRVHPMND